MILVLAKTTQRTSGERRVLTDHVTNQPRGKEIHVISDNLSAHKTRRVDVFMAEHKKASSSLHPPTDWSWQGG